MAVEHYREYWAARTQARDDLVRGAPPFEVAQFLSVFRLPVERLWPMPGREAEELEATIRPQAAEDAARPITDRKINTFDGCASTGVAPRNDERE